MNRSTSDSASILRGLDGAEGAGDCPICREQIDIAWAARTTVRGCPPSLAVRRISTGEIDPGWVLLPLAAARLKFYRAVVASPALTTIVDITVLMTFFTTAKVLLGI